MPLLLFLRGQVFERVGGVSGDWSIIYLAEAGEGLHNVVGGVSEFVRGEFSSFPWCEVDGCAVGEAGIGANKESECHGGVSGGVMNEDGNHGDVGFECEPCGSGVPREELLIGGGCVESAFGKESEQPSFAESFEGEPEGLYISPVAIDGDAFHCSADPRDKRVSFVVFAGCEVADHAEVGFVEFGEVTCPEEDGVSGAGVICDDDGWAIFGDRAGVVLAAAAEEEAMKESDLVADPGGPADLICV
jgi:hypothetical protein